VRFSLLDGPSLLLLALGAVAAEAGRSWALGAIVGVAGLGRETNLLGAAMISPPRDLRGALRAIGPLLVAIAPLLLWQDYLWSIYRTWSFAGGDQIAGPFVGYVRSWQESVRALSRGGPTLLAVSQLLVIVSVSTQAGFLALNRAPGSPWWRLAVVFGLLMLMVDPVVWLGFPGAITRVVLPLTVGFNILLGRRETRFWRWYVPGNLHLLLSPVMLRA
jgi:hypothetical protein